jgi:PAS domain-containing protein
MQGNFHIVPESSKKERKNSYTFRLPYLKKSKKQSIHFPSKKRKTQDKKGFSNLFTIQKNTNKQDTNTEQSSQFNLLRSIIIILLAIDVVFLTIYQLNQSYFLYGSADLFILITIFFILLFTYVALYFYHYKICVGLLLLSITLPILSNVYISIQFFTESHVNTISFLIIYLIIPMIISSFNLEKRYSISYLAIILISLFSMPLVTNQPVVYQTLFGPILFFIFTSIIILFFKYHAEKIEIIRNKDLIRAKKKTQEIFNAAADGIRIVDKHFNVIDVNDTMVSMAGLPKKEIIGKKCNYSFKSKKFCGTNECSLIKLFNTGQDINRIS